KIGCPLKCVLLFMIRFCWSYFKINHSGRGFVSSFFYFNRTPLDNIFKKGSNLDYTQEGSLDDDEISLNSVQIIFDGELEQFKFIRNAKYKKFELVSNNNLE
ncbi:MAG: hypothetical protein ACI86M_002540, partial [Saprospiraceae bacterium]